MFTDITLLFDIFDMNVFSAITITIVVFVEQPELIIPTLTLLK